MREILWRIQKETRSDEILFRLLIVMARECDHRGNLDLTAKQIGKMAGVASTATLKDRIGILIRKGLLMVGDGGVMKLDLSTSVFESSCQFKFDTFEEHSGINSGIDTEALGIDHSLTALRSGEKTPQSSVATLLTKAPLTSDLPGQQGDSDKSSLSQVREPNERQCSGSASHESDGSVSEANRTSGLFKNDSVLPDVVDNLFIVEPEPDHQPGRAWRVYKDCQHNTHKYDPPSSAKSNRLLKDMANELGIDELVMLIQYYHTRTDTKYVVNRHPLNLLKYDQHRLHADMKNGSQVSKGEARTMDLVQQAKTAAERAKGMS